MGCTASINKQATDSEKVNKKNEKILDSPNMEPNLLFDFDKSNYKIAVF